MSCLRSKAGSALADFVSDFWMMNALNFINSGSFSERSSKPLLTSPTRNPPHQSLMKKRKTLKPPAASKISLAS